jgi:hypothetical protein
VYAKQESKACAKVNDLSHSSHDQKTPGLRFRVTRFGIGKLLPQRAHQRRLHLALNVLSCLVPSIASDRFIEREFGLT